MLLATDAEDVHEARMGSPPCSFPARLEGVKAQGRLLTAGPNPLPDNPERVSGSLIVAPIWIFGRCTEWAEQDPYVDASVYAEVLIKPFKAVFKWAICVKLSRNACGRLSLNSSILKMKAICMPGMPVIKGGGHYAILVVSNAFWKHWPPPGGNVWSKQLFARLVFRRPDSCTQYQSGHAGRTLPLRLLLKLWFLIINSFQSLI